jgi:hypothetical protein
VIPTHPDGLGAGRRVKAAIDRGEYPHPHDAIMIHTYALSLELSHRQASRVAPDQCRHLLDDRGPRCAG